MEDETNPYEPNVSHGVFSEPTKKLSGFLRGVRNGFFGSLPVFVTLTIFIATYGRKPPPIHAAMLEAFQIPAECSLQDWLQPSQIEVNDEFVAMRLSY
jgi:hypothetical protein